MILSYYNLSEALNICDKSLSGTWEQERCYGGIFMENIVGNNKEHSGKEIVNSDIFFPCDSVGRQYREVCYDRQANIFINSTKGDFKKAFDLCSTLEKPYALACYEGLGREAFGIRYGDIETTSNACYKGNNVTQISYCLKEASEYFVKLTRHKESAEPFCKQLPSNYQTECLEHITQYSLSF
jgi:hypothetical protein